MNGSDFSKVTAVTYPSNRWQTARTILGIIVGVASFTVAFSIMEGAAKTIKELTGFNGKYMMVSPKQDQILQQAESGNFDMDDARAIAGVSGVTSISLQKTVRCIPIKYLNQRAQTTIYGTDPNFAVILNRTVIKGRFINDSDLQNERRVCVITSELSKLFFPAGDYLEQSMEINDVIFEIIGCLRPILLPPAYNQLNKEEEGIYIPLTTYRSLFNQYDYDRICFSYAKEYEAKRKVELLKGRIKSILRYHHNITEGFIIKTIDDVTEQPRKRAFMVLIVLFGLSAICLIITGVELQKIVMIKQTELIRENGIRKAINAPISITVPAPCFLYSVAVSAISGIAGVLVGVTTLILMTLLTEIPVYLTWLGCFSGIGCALLTGSVVGIYAVVVNPSRCQTGEMSFD